MKKRTLTRIIILLLWVILIIFGGNYLSKTKGWSLGGASTKGLEAAKETALNNAGLAAEQVTFIKAKISEDDGKAEYEIEFVTSDTKYEYEIDASSKAVKECEEEPIDKTLLYSEGENICSPEEAKAAALSASNLNEDTALLTKIELELDGGVYEYEVEYFFENTLYSFEMNASTGETLKIERDNNRITG